MFRDPLHNRSMAAMSLMAAVFVWVSGCTGYESAESDLLTEGVLHRVLRIQNPPAVVHVIEVDLSADVSVTTVKAKEVLSGLARTSQMWADQGNSDEVVVGVNGDFFADDGRSIGPQVAGGIIVKTGSKRWPVIGFGSQPFIETVTFKGHVIIDGATFEIDNVNAFRMDGEIVFFNRFFGENTKTNKYGVEIRIDSLFPSDGMVGDTLAGIVVGIAIGTGSSPLTQAGGVLSAHGKKAQALLKLIMPGDTVRFCFRFPPIEGRISELIGGFPKIVARGTPVRGIDTLAGPVFIKERHPRTAAGFDRESRTFFLITVDGRQSGYSEGMTLDELASLMVGLGVYEGINLDGGGSTTMVVNGQVVNQPSDEDGERAVSNAVMILSGKN